MYLYDGQATMAPSRLAIPRAGHSMNSGLPNVHDPPWNRMIRGLFLRAVDVFAGKTRMVLLEVPSGRGTSIVTSLRFEGHGPSV